MVFLYHANKKKDNKAVVLVVLGASVVLTVDNMGVLHGHNQH